MYFEERNVRFESTESFMYSQPRRESIDESSREKKQNGVRIKKRKVRDHVDDNDATSGYTTPLTKYNGFIFFRTVSEYVHKKSVCRPCFFLPSDGKIFHELVRSYEHPFSEDSSNF